MYFSFNKICILKKYLILVFFLSAKSYISSSFSRYILSRHGKVLGLDSKSIGANDAVNQNAEALAKAWSEYNNPRSVQEKITFNFLLIFLCCF